jgi:hypothetical protein
MSERIGDQCAHIAQTLAGIGKKSRNLKEAG